MYSPANWSKWLKPLCPPLLTNDRQILSGMWMPSSNTHRDSIENASILEFKSSRSNRKIVIEAPTPTKRASWYGVPDKLSSKYRCLEVDVPLNETKKMNVAANKWLICKKRRWYWSCGPILVVNVGKFNFEMWIWHKIEYLKWSLKNWTACLKLCGWEINWLQLTNIVGRQVTLKDQQLVSFSQPMQIYLTDRRLRFQKIWLYSVYNFVCNIGLNGCNNRVQMILPTGPGSGTNIVL